MDTDGVEIFHVADRDAVVVAIAHDFVLDFFPACDTALDEYLTDHAVFEPLDDRLDKFLFVFGDAAARAAHRVGRTHDQRIPYLIGEPDSRLHIVDDRALWDGFSEFLHRLLEKLTIFCLLDSFEASPQKLDMIFFQNSFF